MIGYFVIVQFLWITHKSDAADQIIPSIRIAIFFDFQSRVDQNDGEERINNMVMQIRFM